MKAARHASRSLLFTKWVGTACGVAGAVIIVQNLGVVMYGFVLFLISSVLWSTAGWAQREVSRDVLQGSFTLINVIGIYRCLTMRLLVLALLLFLPIDLAADDRIVGVASVVDGDTLEIHGTRIRLHGIDAPESAQLCLDAADRPWRCGQQSSLALADRIGRATVACRRTDTDHYGRMIAVCYKGDEDLNAWLVAEGWAVAFRRYSMDYVKLEERARVARKGIWASRFVMPWDWRHGHRIVAAKPAATVRHQGQHQPPRRAHLPCARRTLLRPDAYRRKQGTALVLLRGGV